VSGSFGKRLIDDLLRLGGDIFFCSKRSHGNPFLDRRIGYRKIGVKPLAVESIEWVNDRQPSFKSFSTNPGTDLALILDA
jgi:hypothetical protein